MYQETHDVLPKAPWLNNISFKVPGDPALCIKGVENYESRDYGSRPGELGPTQVGFDNLQILLKQFSQLIMKFGRLKNLIGT